MMPVKEQVRFDWLTTVLHGVVAGAVVDEAVEIVALALELEPGPVLELAPVL